jgi:hypothetical protein
MARKVNRPYALYCKALPNRAFPTHPRTSELTHHSLCKLQLVRFACHLPPSLARIASVSLVFLLPRVKIVAFPQIERSRITRLVGRLVSTAWPRADNPFSARVAPNSRWSGSVRESHRRSRDDHTKTSRFSDIASHCIQDRAACRWHYHTRSFLSPFLSSHSLLLAYLSCPHPLHINTPASGLDETRQIGPFPPLRLVCVLVKQPRPTSRSFVPTV